MRHGRARLRPRAPAGQLRATRIFTDFGAEWRNAGCSMCLGAEPDAMNAGDSASINQPSTSTGQPHLVSPLVAAATAWYEGTLSPHGRPLKPALLHPITGGHGPHRRS